MCKKSKKALKQEQIVIAKFLSAKNALDSRALKPKKSFGQNFMIDERINTAILDTARSWAHNNNCAIVEIGAGTGSLTKHLVKNFSLVHAIERDRDLVPILQDIFSQELLEQKLFIHEADGARFDLATLLSIEKPGILVGNLPYHLTSSILILTLKNYDILRGAIFLVQKEVAIRLAASPNNKDYGFLTALLGLAFNIEIIMHVGKSSFWPAPKIDSAIIKLSPRDRGISQVNNIDKFLVFVREIFQKRRKKLSTILAQRISKNNLQDLGIDFNLRPENLSPEQFLLLFNNIKVSDDA